MTSSNTSAAPVGRGRAKFLLLAAIFLLPMLLAWLIYFGPQDWRPAGRTHHGELINPAQPLTLDWAEAAFNQQENPLLGKWTLLQVMVGPCDSACESRVIALRQLRKSLHRKRTRVQRLILVPDEAQAARLREQLLPQNPLLRVHAIAARQHAELLRLINQDEPLAVGIVDPLGNYLMRYTPEVGLRGMYKDIKRLLKLSNIG